MRRAAGLQRPLPAPIKSAEQQAILTDTYTVGKQLALTGKHGLLFLPGHDRFKSDTTLEE